MTTATNGRGRSVPGAVTCGESGPSPEDCAETASGFIVYVVLTAGIGGGGHCGFSGEIPASSTMSR